MIPHRNSFKKKIKIYPELLQVAIKIDEEDDYTCNKNVRIKLVMQLPTASAPNILRTRASAAEENVGPPIMMYTPSCIILE